jgi:hypothetical protein
MHPKNVTDDREENGHNIVYVTGMPVMFKLTIM